MTIRIVRNAAGNCITFRGTTNPIHFNSCLSGEVDAVDSTLVNIVNDIQTAETGVNQYEFFNIPFTEFRDASNVAFTTAQEVADYVTLVGNVSAPEDINVGYKGVYDASTGLSPSVLYDGGTVPVNGDWFYINTAGTIGSDEYRINDIIKYNDVTEGWDQILSAAATVEELEASALNRYDIHVDGGYTGTIRNGSSVHPYNDLAVAIAASNPGQSILIKGTITAPVGQAVGFQLPHGLKFYGADECVVQFAIYDSTNGDLFRFDGTDNTQEFLFENMTLANAGGYGLYIKKTARTQIRDCKIKNNGWSGNGLHTVLPSATSGVLGYDSLQASLQAFWAGTETSNGGAMRIEEATTVTIVNNEVSKNLRGIRVQDCGIGGSGFITRNTVTQNIESGIYVAAGALGGCHGVVVAINSSAYNANNGLLVIGGINNKFSQNEVNGNWNAGFCACSSSNATLRDCGLYDNNRSAYNGIGNTSDAKASIQINDAYDLLGTAITYNPAFRFIAEILDTQVHYTGLGSNTDKIGFLVTSAVGDIADNDKNIIKVDDVGFIGQDYAIDFSEVDLTNLRVSLGDNSYQTIGQKAVKAPLAGNYNELPFSNHVTSVPEVDIVVDTLKQTIALHEGVSGNVINVYNMNELQSVLAGTKVDIIQRASDKIQLRGLTLGNVYINGVVAGTNLATMNDSINAAFNMDLVQYKDFIETEVGVEGAGDSATFYYIESPDGVFHYPLFKTEAEANQVDTDLTGAGESHTHTYADDASGTTWYMPNVSNHMDASSAPLNGLYTAPNGESIESVVWNIQPTEDDASYVPTFTSITYNVQEGSAVNIQYKPSGMTDSFNITGVPAGYVDDGYSIIGTAEDISNGYGQSIQHVINVTKANAFGSVQGTITINVLADLAGNEFTIVDQAGAIKFTQDGGATVLDFNTVTFNAGSTYKFYVDGATLQTNDVFDIVDANGNTVTGGDGLSMTGGSGPGYAGTYFQYVIPADVAPGKFLTFTDGATGTAYPDVPLTLAGSTYSATVTGITLEGPSANQTGTNLFDVGDHGWLSIDEPLGAGQRLVLSGAFLADVADAMGDNSIISIGLKDGAWANTIGNANPSGMEGNMMINIYRQSSTNFQMYGYNLAAGIFTTQVIGTHLYNPSQFLNYNAFLEVTSDGNNIRVGHALTSAHDANTETYENWGSGIKLDTGDQGFGITEVDVMVKGLPISGSTGTTDADDIDWTALSEISTPVPPTSALTNWTKAVNFSGGSEYLKDNNNSRSTQPIKMNDQASLVPEHSTDSTKTSDHNLSRPWATAVVFNIDNVSQQQHIWNQGQPPAQGDNNIYLKLNASKQLIFGWGKEGTGYNECTIHPLPSAPNGYLGHNAWYGVYIAHKGTRLNATDATAANLADCFDIRIMNSAGNNWTLGSNLSVPAAWTSTGYRMDRSVTGDFTIGGRGYDRSFQGEVASMVVTTLNTDSDMPNDAEIKEMVTDPNGWVATYKVGSNFRHCTTEYSQYDWDTSAANRHWTTQVWLMGDGTTDSFSNGIRNQVNAVTDAYTKVVFTNMASNDIENVSIPGLS